MFEVISAAVIFEQSGSITDPWGRNEVEIPVRSHSLQKQIPILKGKLLFPLLFTSVRLERNLAETGVTRREQKTLKNCRSFLTKETHKNFDSIHINFLDFMLI